MGTLGFRNRRETLFDTAFQVPPLPHPKVVGCGLNSDWPDLLWHLSCGWFLGSDGFKDELLCMGHPAAMNQLVNHERKDPRNQKLLTKYHLNIRTPFIEPLLNFLNYDWQSGPKI